MTTLSFSQFKQILLFFLETVNNLSKFLRIFVLKTKQLKTFRITYLITIMKSILGIYYYKIFINYGKFSFFKF